MKTLLFALVLLTGCSTIAPVVSIRHTSTGPLVAKFEPSIPPPPSAVTPANRGIASAELTDAEIDKLWVQANNRRDSLIRSNPTHFWAWMKKNLPVEFKDIKEFKGQVIADGHYFNFGDVHSDTKSGLALVDVDDSGVGALYLDFVRYAIFVRAYLDLKADPTPDLFAAYLSGLQGKKSPAIPSYLVESTSKTRKQVIDEHGAWVKKKLKKDDQLDNESLEITGYKDLEKKSPNIVKTGKDLADLLVKSGKFKKIFDSGYKVNDSGSSRGMDRFWYSLKTNDGRQSIYECKQLSQPATAYYSKQKNHLQRINDVLAVYSDAITTDSFEFDTPTDSYWCRPKHFEFFGRDEVDKDNDTLKKQMKAKNIDSALVKKLLDYSNYLAYWIGQKQSTQKDSAGLIQSLTGDQEKTVSDTIDLIKTYEDHVAILSEENKVK